MVRRRRGSRAIALSRPSVKSAEKRLGRRDVSFIARVPSVASVMSLGALLAFPSSPRFGRLVEVEDRRSFHPSGVFRDARSPRRSSVSVISVSRSPAVRRRSRVPSVLHFSAPSSVLVCVRRGRRREVLFAGRRVGVGRHVRRPRRNYMSSVHCRSV